jgi:hypothetical protein
MNTSGIHAGGDKMSLPGFVRFLGLSGNSYEL